MVRCDLFSVSVGVEDGGTGLTISIDTDLPAGTLVNIDCTRTYATFKGRLALWTVFDGRAEVQPSRRGDINGLTAFVDLAAGDAEARREFDEALGAFSSGIRTPVSDTVTITTTVGARQRLKAFGPRNENLTGSEVGRDGDISIVRSAIEINVPIRAEFQPVHDVP